MDDNKILCHDGHVLDPEKARDMPSEIPMAVSYTFWDRFVERLVHPASALSFCLLSFAIFFLGLHILWIAAWYADYKTLVPLAFHYNKAAVLPAETSFNFNVKGLCVVMSAGGASIMVGLGALAFAHLAYIMPRKTLLEYPLPLAPFMKYMCDFTTIQITFSLVLALYLQFFYEIEPAEASGCHSYTNGKGQLVARCTFESAACYTQDWPDDIERGNAGQLCSEARLIKHLSMAIVPCAIVLLLVYKHIETLQWRYTTPQERLQLAEEEQQRKEERKMIKAEEERKKKWYLRSRTWTIISVIFTVLNTSRLFLED